LPTRFQQELPRRQIEQERIRMPARQVALPDDDALMLDKVRRPARLHEGEIPDAAPGLLRGPAHA
jgi:hypothetical protein